MIEVEGIDQGERPVLLLLIEELCEWLSFPSLPGGGDKAGGEEVEEEEREEGSFDLEREERRGEVGGNEGKERESHVC